MHEGVSQPEEACQPLFGVVDETKRTILRFLSHTFCGRIKRTPVASSGIVLLLFHRDGRDFNAGIVDQGRCLDGRPGWLGVRHDALVNLVHVRKFANVGEIDRDTDDVLQFKAAGLRTFSIFSSAAVVSWPTPPATSLSDASVPS